jgi:hypothetical protein
LLRRKHSHRQRQYHEERSQPGGQFSEKSARTCPEYRLATATEAERSRETYSLSHLQENYRYEGEADWYKQHQQYCVHASMSPRKTPSKLPYLP